MRKLYFIVISLFLTSKMAAQYVIQGIVSNNEAEKLEFASLYIPILNLSAGTDKSGKYIFENVPNGTYKIECTFFGYKKSTKEVNIVNENRIIDFILEGELYALNQIEIVSNRNKITTFPAGSYLNKASLQKENMGQDVPVLLQWQPSITTTSDAGAGIGYTSMRIRGVDQARINVTVNDIPINDAESQNVFWVDMPDMASSTENLKIQRGVGPSTNGAGAYGGTVALNTFGIDINPSIEAGVNYGSFNTSKYNLKLNSGLIKNQYNIEARYSKINSDGYIDRAYSNLASWYLEFSKINAKSSIRLLAFEGKERTYQAWNGVPEALLNGDAAALKNHYFNNLGSLYKNTQDSINLFNSGRTYNTYQYENQVDDYTQTHSQLHLAHNFTNKITAKVSLHYTRGLGFFEQYRYNDKLENYGIPYIVENGDSLKRANIIRRRWLDNHFYGFVSKMEYNFNANQILSIGGGYNEYYGGHFGQVINIEKASKNDFNNYYYNNADKSDGNFYIRHESAFKNGINFSLDLQYRKVNYTVWGNDNDLKVLDVNSNYNFFNPKLSFNYSFSTTSHIISSFAIANREPDRSDLLDNPKNNTPLSEKLLDYELGYNYKSSRIGLELNGYYMNYKDQLVLTGELNDVGNSIRTNVPKSSRLGLEIIMNTQIDKHLRWQANATISKNKISQFNEILYDYTNGFEVIENNYSRTDIAFSPNVVAASSFIYSPIKTLDLSLATKYIGRQYLDNTSNENRSIKPYTYTNLLASFSPEIKSMKGIGIKLQVNNLFNTLYNGNGYTYSYKFGALITENFLFPQAGANFIFGFNLKL